MGTPFSSVRGARSATLALVFAFVFVALGTGCADLLGDFTVQPEPDASVDDGGLPDATFDDASRPDASRADARADATSDGAPADADADADAADAAPDASNDAGSDAGCGVDTKVCAGKCVARTDPNYGCSDTGCAPCALPNASAACVAGACAVAQCTNGYKHCSASVADGCEVHTAVDVGNCGACGNACKGTDGGSATCAGGACASVACAPGKADCNGKPADGCEVDTTTSPTNCGTCGDVCGAVNGTPSCSGSTCKFTCTAPYAHCATSANSAGCNVDTSSDPKNCGGCGAACSQGQRCAAGKCTCDTTSGCSGCCNGAACVAAAFPSCGIGGASCVGCDAIRNDECTGNSCGCAKNSGQTCPVGEHCTATGCLCDATSCASGCCSGATCQGTPVWPACGKGGAACGACDSHSDRCSATGGCACGAAAACGAGQACAGGACTCNATSCAKTCCGAACLDTTSDANNCGACGRSCGGAACTNGVCASLVVATGNTANGTSLAIDASNAYWLAAAGVMSAPLGGNGAPASGPFNTAYLHGYQNNVVTDRTSSPEKVWYGAGDANGNYIFSMTPDGATSTSVASGQLLALDANSVWYYDTDTVFRKAKSGIGPIYNVMSGFSTLANASGMKVDSSGIVYLADGTKLASCGSSCGTSPTVLASAGAPEVIAIDPASQFIYFAGGSTIYRCPIAGCPNPAAPTAWATGQKSVNDMTVDGTNVYWTDGGNRTVMRCAAGATCTSPLTLDQEAGGFTPGGIAVDGTWVYFTMLNGTTSLRKVPK